MLSVDILQSIFVKTHEHVGHARSIPTVSAFERSAFAVPAFSIKQVVLQIKSPG